MEDVKRFLGLMRPYIGRLLAYFMLANLMMLFNLLSFVVGGPFFQVLFEPENYEVAAPKVIDSMKSLSQYGEYWLSSYVQAYGQDQGILLICGLIILIYFLKNLFRYLSVYTIIPVRYGVSKTLRDRLFDKVLALPLAFYSEERKGNIIVKMTNDVEEFRKSTLDMLESIMRDPLMIIVTFVVMFSFSTRLTLISVGLVVFIVILIAGVSGRIRQKSTKAQAKMGEITSIVEETISGLRIVKGFNATAYSAKKFQRENDTHRNILTRISWRIDIASPLSEFLGAVALSCLLIIGGRFVAKGIISPSNFIIFLGAFWSMITPLKNFSKSLFDIKKGLGASDRLYSLLNETSSIREVEHPKSIQHLQSEIVYKDVSFAYHEEKKVLEHISFQLEKGKILALVGASGSGKSTLVDLLPRFYDVPCGSIEIDGVNIKDYKISDLRGLMGIVSQEPILFNDTIANNIAFGLENVSLEQIVSAAKTANAHDFILAADNGYETIIGDRGVKLSGGQRQRLTIARAILRNPQILILDEATSALDSKSEQLVQDALAKLMKNRTSIVIAHRLSTIQYANEILVLQDGKIVERGTHETLLAKQGIYEKLVDLQRM
jgi:ABC-type multidrug transport system fused ATPase/permease subunit